MAFFTVNNTNIAGMAAAVPKEKESNWQYDLLSETEKKLLIKTTGVETRHLAPKGLTTSDLCFSAAEKLLAELPWRKEEVEVVIFLSQSRDYYLPATAIILQDRLGLSKNVMAFDVSLGCSGFPYGLSIMGNFMAKSGLKKGLLMMGDVSSATCHKTDKSTYPLFGDAGTVTAVEYKEEAPKMSFQLESDGSGHQAIMIPDGGLRNRASKASFEVKKVDQGIHRCAMNLALDGLEVFNFSVGVVPKAIRRFFEKTKTSPASYDYFLMHQANKLMNESIRKKLKFPEEKVPYSIREYGNTSSASIPLTLVTELGKKAREGHLSLLASGFGVGLSWGVVALQTHQLCCPELLEI